MTIKKLTEITNGRISASTKQLDADLIEISEDIGNSIQLREDGLYASSGSGGGASVEVRDWNVANYEVIPLEYSLSESASYVDGVLSTPGDTPVISSLIYSAIPSQGKITVHKNLSPYLILAKTIPIDFMEPPSDFMPCYLYGNGFYDSYTQTSIEDVWGENLTIDITFRQNGYQIAGYTVQYPTVLPEEYFYILTVPAEGEVTPFFLEGISGGIVSDATLPSGIKDGDTLKVVNSGKYKGILLTDGDYLTPYSGLSKTLLTRNSRIVKNEYTDLLEQHRISVAGKLLEVDVLKVNLELVKTGISNQEKYLGLFDSSYALQSVSGKEGDTAAVWDSSRTERIYYVFLGGWKKVDKDIDVDSLNLSTSSVVEGSRKYYTSERFVEDLKKRETEQVLEVIVDKIKPPSYMQVEDTCKIVVGTSDTEPMLVNMSKGNTSVPITWKTTYNSYSDNQLQYKGLQVDYNLTPTGAFEVYSPIAYDTDYRDNWRFSFRCARLDLLKDELEIMICQLYNPTTGNPEGDFIRFYGGSVYYGETNISSGLSFNSFVSGVSCINGRMYLEGYGSRRTVLQPLPIIFNVRFPYILIKWKGNSSTTSQKIYEIKYETLRNNVIVKEV